LRDCLCPRDVFVVVKGKNDGARAKAEHLPHWHHKLPHQERVPVTLVGHGHELDLGVNKTGLRHEGDVIAECVRHLHLHDLDPLALDGHWD